MSTHFEFDSGPYRASHMKEPRGFGSWAFQVHGNREILFSPAMTLRDAKRWVKAEILKVAPAGIDYVEVKVLP